MLWINSTFILFVNFLLKLEVSTTWWMQFVFLCCFRYTLAQEHGDLINLHDWFQSFKTIVLRPSKKGKPKSKQSPLPKKRKDMNESENKSEASIQYPIAFSFAFVFISNILRSLVEGICSEIFVAAHETQKLLWNCVCVCVCVVSFIIVWAYWSSSLIFLISCSWCAAIALQLGISFVQYRLLLHWLSIFHWNFWLLSHCK